MRNLESLYKGKLNPLQQTGTILLINILTAAALYFVQPEKQVVWVVLQGLVFFYAAMTIGIAVFSRNDPKFYYPVSILTFIALFKGNIVLAEWLTGSTADAFPHFYNFMILNVVFFALFLMISLLYRGIKHFLETMD